jgi:hypothetical protein
VLFLMLLLLSCIISIFRMLVSFLECCLSIIIADMNYCCHFIGQFTRDCTARRQRVSVRGPEGKYDTYTCFHMYLLFMCLCQCSCHFSSTSLPSLLLMELPRICSIALPLLHLFYTFPLLPNFLSIYTPFLSF